MIDAPVQREAATTHGWCIKCWDITSLGSCVQVVGFFDVAAARLCAGDRPITALVGGASCSTHSALQRSTSTSVLGHFGPFFEDRTDRGPK